MYEKTFATACAFLGNILNQTLPQQSPAAEADTIAGNMFAQGSI